MVDVKFICEYFIYFKIKINTQELRIKLRLLSQPNRKMADAPGSPLYSFTLLEKKPVGIFIFFICIK
jgi:hypothetical protein